MSKIETHHNERFTLVLALPKSKHSARGMLEYRRTLKAVIQQCEQMLGTYRKLRHSDAKP